eukprot:scaffold1959_cov243-Pinguiococcus_pyrenoidosus.AAC.8
MSEAEEQVFETTVEGDASTASHHPWKPGSAPLKVPLDAQLSGFPDASTLLVCSTGPNASLSEAAIRAALDGTFAGELEGLAGGRGYLLKCSSTLEAEKALAALSEADIKGEAGEVVGIHASWTGHDFSETPTARLAAVATDRFTVAYADRPATLDPPAEITQNVLERGTMEMASALEMFRGRAFPSEASIGPKELLEAPEDRLLRLKAELSDLQSDLRRAADEEKGRAAEATAESVRIQAWEALAVDAAALEAQADEVAADPSTTFTVAGVDQNLTSSLEAALARLEGRDASSADDSGKHASGNSGAARLLATLDTRLQRLERVVGLAQRSSSGTSKSGSSLRAQLEALETRIRALDGAALKDLENAARAASRELEALRTARKDPSGAGGAAGAWKDAEEAAKIDGLWDSVCRWDGFADELPTLLRRFRALHTLHSEAAMFSQRLRDVEASQNETVTATAETRKILAETQQSLAENVRTVQANLAALGERMERLSERMAHLPGK